MEFSPSSPSAIDLEAEAERETRRQAIQDGTLSDDECILELHERKAVFLADEDWLPECRRYGEKIFDQAIERDVHIALESGQRVVGVLHLVLVHIGGLYYDNERLKFKSAPNAGAESVANMGPMIEGVTNKIDNDISRESEAEIIAISSEGETEDDDDSDILSEKESMHVPEVIPEQDEHTTRLNAAIAARRKRRQLTHGASGFGDSPISRRSRSAVPDYHAVSSPATQRSRSVFTDVEELVSIAHSPSAISAARRSRNLVPDAEDEFDVTYIPSPPPQLPSSPQMVPEVAKAATRNIRQPASDETADDAARSPILSSQVLLSPQEQLQTPPSFLDALQVPAHSAQSRKRSEPSPNPPAPLFVGGPGNKQGHNRRSVLRVQQTRSLAIAPPSDAPRKKRKIATSKGPKQAPSRATTRRRTRVTQKQVEIADSQDSDSDIDVEMPLRPLEKKSRTTSPRIPTSKSNAPDVHKTAASSAVPSAKAFTFLPLPTLTPRDHAPFRKGAEIALDNILSDHVENPDDSLVEIIEELEENQPAVDGWERKTIVKGNMWVCTALRQALGKFGKQKQVDVEELLGQLGKWMEKGLKGR
ncbi:hypothetical protein P153DRAFT_396517 [Dothidotthia symphoricarpi CBS 119687]|uniref:Uncharacterized protein n=1 Tax=Dothidotthia symphoricarpi CBS 119687 TaxID=1392245 RepID=A0A6A6ABN0_9PLEO|nr:uncharacterized protein P153DRAFT_396517 [Dothidotthia symphoricarpi CBS 119687]KAF2129220.1 hypothetical protein P153DRAFT_396517 [Dothidotthia symphoricarpi CBS 119687]